MTTNIFKSILIVISITALMLVSGCADSTPKETVSITTEISEEIIPTKVMMVCSDEQCENPITEITISRNSPLWFLGETMPTVEAHMDGTPSVSDMSFLYEEGGWGLDYGEEGGLSFVGVSRSSFRDSKVTMVAGYYSPQLRIELFNDYDLGYVKMGELKALLGIDSPYYDWDNSGLYGIGTYFYFEGDTSTRYKIDFYSDSNAESVEVSICTTMYVRGL